MTRVVSVRGVKIDEARTLIAQPGWRYAGRNVQWWRDSGLGNPFVSGLRSGLSPSAAARLYCVLLTRGVEAARIEATRHYDGVRSIPKATELSAARSRAVSALPGLRGGRVACWCGEAEIGPDTWPGCLLWAPACHAVTLAAAAEGLILVPGFDPE